MDVERIFRAFNEEEARHILIGGMNFFLLHEPVSRFDVDLWIDDTQENRARASRAFWRLEAEWGRTEADWKRVPADPSWMTGQGCFCLTSAAGSVEIFLAVEGLEDGFESCLGRAVRTETIGGVKFAGLADSDMIRRQEALPEGLRKLDRVRALRLKLSDGPDAKAG